MFWRPPGVCVKHAFSRIGKRSFLSCLDVLARFGTLPGLSVRIVSSDRLRELVRHPLFRGCYVLCDAVWIRDALGCVGFHSILWGWILPTGRDASVRIAESSENRNFECGKTGGGLWGAAGEYSQADYYGPGQSRSGFEG